MLLDPDHDGGRTARGEAARRRTCAVISHPDAGESALTEALALHARVIPEAGHIHGKAGRRSPSVEVLQRDSDGALLALFPDAWRVGRVQRDLPDVILEPLVPAGS